MILINFIIMQFDNVIVALLLLLFVCSTHGLSFLPKAEKYVSTNVIKTIYNTPEQRAEKCRKWYENDQGVDHLKLPHCPPTDQQAEESDTFSEDKSPPQLHHPGADRCYRSGGGFWSTVWKSMLTFSDPGGQQCCYKNNELITDGPGAGTADRGALLWNHWWHDVLPSYFCCLDVPSMCRLYLEKRPVDTGTATNSSSRRRRRAKSRGEEGD